MSTDNRQMWAELGIDLAQHDVLLGAIPALFQKTYLCQRNRPKRCAVTGNCCGMPFLLTCSKKDEQDSVGQTTDYL